MKKIIVLCVCTITCFLVEAQISPDSLSNFLVGRTKKEWVLDLWKDHLGSAGNGTNQCIGGESYIFYKNGNLQDIKCKNGKRDTIPKRWYVINENNDNALYIDGKKYSARPKRTVSPRTGIKEEVELNEAVVDGQPVTTFKNATLKYERP